MITTKVTLQITLDIEHSESKTLDEVQGTAYWLLVHALVEAKMDTYNVNGCQVKKFDINIKRQ